MNQRRLHCLKKVFYRVKTLCFNRSKHFVSLNETFCFKHMKHFISDNKTLSAVAITSLDYSSKS